MAETWLGIAADSPYPVTNLPFGIGHDGDQRSRAWAAIGDHALDLDGLERAGLLGGIELPADGFGNGSLNEYLASGVEVWSACRARLQELLTDAAAASQVDPHLRTRLSLTMGLPVEIGDYVDFYSSIHHATNLGRLFRPDSEPLLPNWRHLPVGYHGRSGTVVPDGTDIVRPHGLRLVDGVPEFGPTRSLDIELEIGTVIGVGSDLGHPVPISDAGRHLAGICLVNDWSARDIQAYEYVPLGPFLGKSFATSMSPWLVSIEALEPFRLSAPPQDPPVADYLSTDERWGLDLHLEVLLDSAAMRSAGHDPLVISSVGFADMYWTPAQQLAHMTVNGASVRAGDLFASGTVSGPEPGSEGSLIELTRRGERPIELPDGTTRTFLHDGDRVELRGWAGRDPDERIGLGSVCGTIATRSTADRSTTGGG